MARAASVCRGHDVGEGGGGIFLVDQPAGVDARLLKLSAHLGATPVVADAIDDGAVGAESGGCDEGGGDRATAHQQRAAAVDDVISGGKFFNGLDAIKSAHPETEKERAFPSSLLIRLLRTGGSCASLAGHD